MAEGGANYSLGQRQLFCLARALLKNSRLLVLDECTASVDPETDALIRGVLASAFGAYTVFNIAHRLDVVAGHDRVLVLDRGAVAEFDTPRNLLRADGLFARMVADSGQEAHLRALIAGTA